MDILKCLHRLPLVMTLAWLLPACLLSPSNGDAQVIVNTTVMPPVPPYLGQLSQEVSQHLSITIRNGGAGAGTLRLKLAGTIERLSPSPISVSLRPDYIPAQPILLGPRQSVNLTRDMLEAAFGNFEVNDLVFTNTDLAHLREGVNYKLPEGVYRICVAAYDFDRPGYSAPLSTPGTGCAIFTICYTASAPQLVQPISTMMAAGAGGFQPFTPPSSQVNFTWTPPATTCGTPLGMLTYDLEIRQVFAGQTITDAVNNPYVFHQAGIPSTTFILDTLKYPHVLVSGTNYITRVKANLSVAANSPVSVANQGYSQIGAFAYTAPARPAPTTAAATPAAPADPSAPGAPGPFVAQAACPANNIGNTTPIAAFNPNGQDLSIDGFHLHIDQATTNNDGSYKGNGYIIWHPLAADIRLQVAFDAINVNTDKVVYGGTVHTAMDPAAPAEWSPFATSDPATALSKLSNSSYAALANRLSQGTHLLDQAAGNTEMSFPMGWNTSLYNGPVTLAVMGLLFQPSCANMDVLLTTNLADMGAWLPLTGVGLPVAPDKMAPASAAVLFLSQDRNLSLNGADFNLKGCAGSNTGVDTTGGTYVVWRPDGVLNKIVGNAHIVYREYSSVKAADSKGQPTGNPFGVHARFTFNDWNDWIAFAMPDSALEITALPGFPVSPSAKGGYFDHSVKLNPPGMQAILHYSGDMGPAWQGLYLSSPTVSMPAGFTSGSGAVSFPFAQFILDPTGVTASLTQDNVLTIDKGSLSGWPFSIDHISVGILQDNIDSDMQMTGGLKIPVCDDPIPYTCNLNAGADNAVTYQFNVVPAGTYRVGMWSASMTIDDNSTFKIVSQNDTFVITALLDGGISIGTDNDASLPKISFNALTFQNMKLSNYDPITHAFKFDAGAWAFNGLNLTGLGNTNPGGGGGGGGGGGLVTSGSSKDVNKPKSTINGTPYDPAEDPANAPGSGGSSPQGSASSLKVNILAFKPYMMLQSADPTEVDMGITFGLSVELDVSTFAIGGSAIVDIYGIAHFPPGGKPVIDPHPHINLDSIGIKFADAPYISIDGGVKLYREDKTFGDGAKGILNASFLNTVSISAAAIFGKTTGANVFNYWGVAAQAYWSKGIYFPPGLTLNGFGGGFHYNMGLASIDMATETDPSTLIAALTPKKDTCGFDAQVIMGYLDPSLVYIKPTIMADFSTSGGLAEIKIQGPGEIMAKSPPNGKGIISVMASATYTHNPDNFNASLIVSGSVSKDALQGSTDNSNAGKADANQANQDVSDNTKSAPANVTLSVNIPIEFNVGQSGEYLYIGKPSPPYSPSVSSMVNAQLSFDAKILHAEAIVYAYLDAGTALPTAPYIPAVLESSTTSGSPTADKMVTDFTSLITSLSQANTPTNNAGTASNPGFLFGAGIHLDAGLDLVVVDADGSLDIGFASMLEHFDPAQVISSGCSTTGVIGFNNWYAMAIFYGNLTMDLKLFGLSIASLNAGAIMTAGLPSPTWANGDVSLDVSVLLALHYHGEASFHLGTPCTIMKDPLDSMRLIDHFGPTQPDGQAPSDVYAIPYVVATLPLNQDYPIMLNTMELRTYRFMVDQFDVTSNKGTVLSGTQTPQGQNEIDLRHGEMLCGNATYKAHVSIRAYQVQNGQLTDPLGADGKPETIIQDTTFTFNTGPRPSTIELQNLLYSYPMSGQRYLLKNEFGGKGQVAVGSDVGYLMDNSQQDDCNNPAAVGASTGNTNSGTNPTDRALSMTKLIQGATLVMKFISKNGGDTLQTPFTYTYSQSGAKGTLDFKLPPGLKNSDEYWMQAWVTPAPVQSPVAGLTAPPATPANSPSPATSPGRLGAKLPVATTLNGAVTNGNAPPAKAANANMGMMPTTLADVQLLAATGPHCIFTAYFGTSAYSNFADKLTAYGQWKGQDALAVTSEIPLYSDAAAPEPFDVWEVEGYSSACATNGYQKPTFAPLFGATVPDNAALQNDIDATTFYTDILSLARYASVDLGVPEVRAPGWFMPDRAMSLDNMPYEEALPIPGSLIGKVVSTKTSVKMTAPVPTNPVSARAGTMPTVGAYGLGVAGNKPAPAAPVKPKPGLDWLRDSYIRADYDLVQNFVGQMEDNRTMISALNGMGGSIGPFSSLIGDMPVISAQGSYGSISMNTGQLTGAGDWQPFFTLIDKIRVESFTSFPPTTSRPVTFTYTYTLCGNCGFPTGTLPSSFSYKPGQVPIIEKVGVPVKTSVKLIKN